MRKVFFLSALVLVLGISANVSAETVKVGTKTVINGSYSFKAEFPEKPKMGEGVLRITLWDKDGKQVTDLEIFGSYDMASMAGQHSMAPKTVLTSQKGFYLFPVNFAMRGKWQVDLVFKTKATENTKSSSLYTAAIQVSI
ncbi:hypothetical protein FACS1894190_02210 [Spirochaetia bacterium]|nr:hypothetical protein FACS1894190_02210 [Spirochaetia bacterium]